MRDQSVRNLSHLLDTASTSRVLNLVSAWKKNRFDCEYIEKPFFNNAVLNKSIILKHKLRSNEHELFSDRRFTGTKILLPIDVEDLKIGGHYVFINQKNFDQIVQSKFGHLFMVDSRDLEILNLLDGTPSLDPFLVKEQFKRFGIVAADCYFELSKADADKMQSFVSREISALVVKAFGDSMDSLPKINSLVTKILSFKVDEDLEPLRVDLKMTTDEFSDGIFCWKGFLYYKWAHVSSIPKINSAVKQIIRYKPPEVIDGETRRTIAKNKMAVAKSLIGTIRSVDVLLSYYDSAYAEMTKNDNPHLFRHFLLNAPYLFKELGENLGVVSHIIDYWSYRFTLTRKPVISAEEFLLMLEDFKDNLAVHGKTGSVDLGELDGMAGGVGVPH